MSNKVIEYRLHGVNKLIIDLFLHEGMRIFGFWVVVKKGIGFLTLK